MIMETTERTNNNLLGEVAWTAKGNIKPESEYDAEKRRRFKSSTPRNAPATYRYFTYSGWSLMLERWRAGNSGPYNFVHYVWGRDLSGSLDGAGGVGGLLATEVDGVWYFPLYDNNGNVTDYVSETGIGYLLH